MNILPISKRMSRGLRSWRDVVLVGALGLAGCSLKAKNVKPDTALDFGHITMMAKFAQAAYAGDAAIRTLCAPAFDDVYIRVIAGTNNKYFLATSTLTQTQLISIAGTSNIENVLLDADQTRNNIEELSVPVHRGFARAARLVYDDVKPRLRPGYRIQLTGHSLGGAEALVLGMLLKAAGTPPETIVTFGQPKVTTDVGADLFKSLPLTRVVNENDVIPALPLSPYRYNAPELVLFAGKAYSLVAERPFSLAEIAAAWQALQLRQAPPELPHHYIANYLVNLESKTTESHLIPYPNGLLPQ